MKLPQMPHVPLALPAAWAATWQRHAKRVDALTLRERAIMFVSVAVALVAAFDHFLLSPRMAEQKALAGQIRQLSREVDGLRAQLAPGRIDGPGGKLVQDLDALRQQQQQLDQALAQLHSGAAAGTQLPDLLERVLRRHERLTLLRLATVKPGTPNPGEVPRQAVQIAMRGSYPDLTQYLADTEAALPALRWGDVSITRQGSGAELSATVLLHRSPT
jgi:MSHA biogenesis protein MshJ